MQKKVKVNQITYIMGLSTIWVIVKEINYWKRFSTLLDCEADNILKELFHFVQVIGKQTLPLSAFLLFFFMFYDKSY